MSTIRTEGGLLSRDLLERIAAGEKTLAGMSPEAYHLAPNEKLGEAITRSWNRLVGAWQSFSDIVAKFTPDEKTGTTITRQRWSLLLFQELGFGQLQTAKAIEIGDKSYPISHAWEHVPIHLVGVRVDLDKRTPGVAGAATASPHSLVQELLNRTDDHLWAIVSNGYRLRLLRDNVALTRQAYVEFDLEAMFTGQAYSDFALLWLVCHQSRFEADVPAKCLLEQWTIEQEERGTRALDQLRVGVEAAITELGAGFLATPANTALRQRLADGALDKQDYYRQLLRTVYRLLFLFVAESRDLLLDPKADATAHERYRRFYSLTRLRTLAESRRGTRHEDQWAALQLVMRALGGVGEPALGLPGLGSFLWKAPACPDLDTAQLDNRHLFAAIRSLSTTAEGGATRAVDYRNLGAEELGSIYESLLELHPVVDVAARSFRLDTAGGNERKTTGSYYTPTSLITELLDSALEPVLDEAAAKQDPEAALLKVSVLDPACGSGHFLIAAAHRIAKRLASVRTGEGEPAPPEVQKALREVVATCIHGIDVNEMAVELCKVSLWMESMEPGKPLAFLDHRIVCGNALIGTTPELLAKGIPDDAFKPLAGDVKSVATSLKKRNKAERAGQDSFDFGVDTDSLQHVIAERYAAIDDVPAEAVADVDVKERRWLDLRHSDEQRRAQLAADGWCAAFVALKTADSPQITTSFVLQAAERPLPGLDSASIDAVVRLREQYRFLHLHLAYPHIFDGSDQEGFSCVIGNPPWERVKLQEKEFFAERSPEIAAAANAAARKRLIKSLEEDDPVLFRTFLDASRQAEGESHFLRTSGRFPLCGRGDVNTYSVFAELMRDVSAATGSTGIITPSGIATDNTTKEFFSDLVTRRSLVSLLELENNGFFVGIGQGHMVRFCLLTLRGAERVVQNAEFMFFGQSLAELRDEGRRFSLSFEDFELLNPNTMTCPLFHSRREAEVSKRIYRRIPVFVRTDATPANNWGVAFRALFHMSNDSPLFLTSEVLEQPDPDVDGPNRRFGSDECLPLYEAKLTSHYNHRHADYARMSGRAHILPNIPEDELRDPVRVVEPWYWVRRDEVRQRLGSEPRWHLAWRDVTDARASARTCVASILPGVGAEGGLLIASPSGGAPAAACLVAVWNSFVFDFCARQKVGGIHLKFFHMQQLPVPRPESFSATWAADGVSAGDWISSRVLELSYTAWDLRQFARDLGYDGPPFAWDARRRALLRAELDACFFHLYGVERDDVDYIMDTFPIVKRKDIASSGEYRTKRVILEMYDAMAKALEAGEPYQTMLDPPPADPSLCHPASTRPEWARI